MTQKERKLEEHLERMQEIEQEKQQEREEERLQEIQEEKQAEVEAEKFYEEEPEKKIERDSKNKLSISDQLFFIIRMIEDQGLLKKDVLNFKEACKFLDISSSHLYKLTSRKEVPHFQPQGKKLWFKRSELELWLLRNRKSSKEEIESTAADYVIQNKPKI